MKLAMVQCPAWSVDRPPYALGLISSLLRASSQRHEVALFDFNVEMYRRAERDGKRIRFMLTGKAEEKFGPESWSGWAIEWDWGIEADVAEFIRVNEDYLERCIERILATEAPCVGFSVQHTSKLFSLDLARRLKERDPGKIIIFGGPDCFPNYFFQMEKYGFIDVVCQGECEGALCQLLSDLEENGLEDPERYDKYRGYKVRTRSRSAGSALRIVQSEDRAQPIPIDLNELPMADWEWVDFSQYTSKSIPLITSRGCIRRCNFCSEAGAETTSWGAFRYRDARHVMEEIRLQYSRHQFDYLWFTDSVFNGSMKMVNELCDLLVEADLDFQWQAQMTIRKDMSPEVFRKMKASGCHMIHWGLESGSDTVLKMMRKGYGIGLAKTVIAAAHEADLQQNVNLIVGYPGETEEHLQETMEFMEVLDQFDIVNPPVAICSVNPGANLFYMLDELDIDLGVDGRWFIRDGSNTHEIRLDRKRRLEELLGQMLASRSGYKKSRRAKSEQVLAGRV